MRQQAGRRQDFEIRKRVAEMTPEEIQRELLTDKLTGLPNLRAYEEAPKKAVLVKSDVDGLKWVNDELGDDAGDELLRAKAKALMEEGVEAYHKSGDKFYSQFDTQEQADDAMKRVVKRLEESIIKVINPDDKIRRYKGWRFSYGTGAESRAADAALREHKRIREGTGERSGRWERPIGLVEVAEGERVAETGGKDKDYPAAIEVIAPALKEEMAVDGNVQTTLFKGEDAAGYEGVSGC